MRLNQIISAGYPKMTAYVSVTDENGRPAEVRPEQFAAYVDDVKVRGPISVKAASLSTEGTAYAVIISANGMNSGPPLFNQQFATKKLLDALSPSDVVSVFFHGSEVKAVFEYQPMEEQKGPLRAVIDKEIEAKGSQPQIYDAVVKAAGNLEKSNKTRKVIVLMSDGRDAKSNYTQEEMFQIIEKVNIPVYCIGFTAFGEGSLDILETIARYTGGLYTLARDVKDIPDAMMKIYDQINRVFVLSFKDNKLFFAGDDKPHLLKITVEDHSGTVHSYDRKFVAVSAPVPIWLIAVAALACLLIVALVVFLFILRRRAVRRTIGISNRKCEVCGRRMKDDWDACLFCKWLPPPAAKKKPELSEAPKP
ncbi:VWA domain-containing protein [Candidatus Fermentibacteria bacterium]|nr:VWA domain-containing protein [Candidatus Fermentibacteria bacterium]